MTAIFGAILPRFAIDLGTWVGVGLFAGRTECSYRNAA
jgi:hypothetical protein